MLANLRALFGVIVDIMLLRRGPEHLPASPVLLAIVVALNYVLSSAAQLIFLPAPPAARTPSPWIVELVALVLILIWFRAAFQVARKPERFVQTMTAIFAMNIVTLPAVPLFAALLPYSTKATEEPAPVALALLAALVWAWLLAVMLRIVKSAFEWPWIGAVFFLMGSGLAILTMLGLIFGDSQPAG